MAINDVLVTSIYYSELLLYVLYRTTYDFYIFAYLLQHTERSRICSPRGKFTKFCPWTQLYIISISLQNQLKQNVVKLANRVLHCVYDRNRGVEPKFVEKPKSQENKPMIS